MNRLCTKIEPSVPLPRVRTPRAVPDRKGCYRNTLGYHGNETLRHQYLRRTRCLALLLPLLLVNRALFISSKLCSSILSCCLGSNRVHAAYRRYNVFRLSSNYVQTGYNASPRCRLVEATHSLSLSLSSVLMLSNRGRAAPSSSSSSTPFRRCLSTLALAVGHASPPSSLLPVCMV